MMDAATRALLEKLSIPREGARPLSRDDLQPGVWAMVALQHSEYPYDGRGPEGRSRRATPRAPSKGRACLVDGRVFVEENGVPSLSVFERDRQGYGFAIYPIEDYPMLAAGWALLILTVE